MNWRNFKIFGFRSLKRPWRPKKIHTLTLFLLIVVGTIAVVTLQSEEAGTESLAQGNQIIGATTIAIKPAQEQQEEEEKKEEEKEFYEYRGECAREIKQRQDDVDDISNQVKGYEEAYTTLTNEYEQKLKELKEEYLVPQDNTKGDWDKAKRQLKKVEDRLSKIRASCDRAFP